MTSFRHERRRGLRHYRTEQQLGAHMAAAARSPPAAGLIGRYINVFRRQPPSSLGEMFLILSTQENMWGGQNYIIFKYTMKLFSSKQNYKLERGQRDGSLKSAGRPVILGTCNTSLLPPGCHSMTAWHQLPMRSLHWDFAESLNLLAYFQEPKFNHKISRFWCSSKLNFIFQLFEVA